MRILISNDDGVYSPGLLALARVATGFGEVRIVAPDVEQSSSAHSISSSRPLSYKRTKLPGFDAFRVNGTPADCVALGVYHWEKIDLVLSGINLGPNLGNAIWHSGTLAAAKQAALFGLRGIAFSTPVTSEEPDFTPICEWVERALRILVEDVHLPLVNVNVPPHPVGLCWARQSVRHYDGKVVPGRDPLGREHFWFTVKPIEQVEAGTDRWAIHQNLVAITPLRLDLTDEPALRSAQEKRPLLTHAPA